MPDYSVIELLCHELDITLAELLDGEEKEPGSIRVYDDEQVKELLAKVQKMESHYKYAAGALMMVIGFLSLVLTSLFGGSHFQDFLSGCLFGMGIALICTGVVAIILSFKKGR